MSNFLVSLVLRVVVLFLGTLFVLPHLGFTLHTGADALLFAIFFGVVLLPVKWINTIVSMIVGTVVGLLLALVSHTPIVAAVVMAVTIFLGNVLPLGILVWLVSLVSGLQTTFAACLLIGAAIFITDLVCGLAVYGRAAVHFGTKS